MKLWRKLANKTAIKVAEGNIILTGRELKRYHQNLSSAHKPTSNLMLALLKRI